MDFLKISWEELARDCIELSKKVKDKKINEIVCISRGGFVVARILSDLLSVTISSISVKSYENLRQVDVLEMTQKLPQDYKNDVVLLVDEVSDTGNTFIATSAYLNTLAIKKVMFHYDTLYRV